MPATLALRNGLSGRRNPSPPRPGGPGIFSDGWQEHHCIFPFSRRYYRIGSSQWIRIVLESSDEAHEIPDGRDANMSTSSKESQNFAVVDVALLIVRVIAGTIMAAHGAQKL